MAELRGADFNILNDSQKLLEIFKEAVVNAGATVRGENYVDFEPQGCSVMVILAESHVGAHTFPEKNYASFDAYTCGQKASPVTILMDVLDTIGGNAFYKLFIRGEEGSIEMLESGILHSRKT